MYMFIHQKSVGERDAKYLQRCDPLHVPENRRRTKLLSTIANIEQCFLLILRVLCFMFINLCLYFKPLIFVLTIVLSMFINCICSTVKHVKCCICICCVHIKPSYLLAYLLTIDKGKRVIL